MPTAQKSFTWTDVAKHNSRESAWVSVAGKVYDVTAWISKHPGGEDVVLLAAGRDASQIFETYHWNTEKAMQILRKYEIGVLADNELPVFPKRGALFEALKSRLAKYFEETGQNPSFHPMMLLRYMLVFFTIALSYYSLYFVPLVRDSFALSVLSSMILGFACAQVGLLPLHDASHCAVTSNPWVWRILGATHDFINGASYLNWCYQHMLGHHPYTNIAGADPDITTADPDIRRIKPSQKWYARYMNQELFVPVLYGLLGIKVRIQDVNLLFFVKKNDSIRVNPPEMWHAMIFWLGKAFFVFYRFLAPVFLFGASWARVLILFAVQDLVSSYWLAFTFQANHVVDDVEWPMPNEKNEVKQDWAEIQIVTAQDYAHRSLFWTNFAGSLNYQIVHHLFPNISQHYYPEIAPIIMDTCKEFGVRYRVKDTFAEAFESHIRHLKQLGNEGASKKVN